MKSRIPIYNRINLIVNKTELEFIKSLTKIELERMEERYEGLDEVGEKELNMVQNLYSKLVILNK
tara:strand:+ start:180 stop:374 length:195 start_codon:yes stop_codon:yes gene_type:complete